MSSTINNTKPEILWFKSEMYIEILKWFVIFFENVESNEPFIFHSFGYQES